jgi:hypothetical protein
LGAVLSVRHRADAFERSFSPLKEQYLEVCVFTEIVSGKEAGGASADDNHVKNTHARGGG